MWVLYFDNLPHYRFGAVKQQLWMILHLPLHLAILGVVEGSQHIALARYIYYSAEKFGTFVYYGCVRNHLDGPKLTKNLTDAIAYFKISDSAQGTLSLPFVYDQIYILGNQSGVCSPKNTSDPNNGMAGIPENFEQLFVRAIGSMFQAFNMDIPLEGKVKGLNVAARSWKVVYTYYWASILLLLICLTMSAALANRNTRFYLRYRLVAIIARGSMVCFSITVLVAGLMRDEFLNNYIGSSWILPTVTLKLWFVCMGDRVSKWLVNRRNRRDGLYKKVDPVDLEGERTVYSG
jgi:hypothetical protein